MNETPTPATDPTADSALKRRLLNRIAVATVMMAGLLGSLAIFDAIYAPQRQPPAQVASEGPPLAQAAKQEPAAAETKPESGQPAQAEEKAVPESTASPEAAPLPPLPAEKPLTRPATSRHAVMRPSEPVAPAASPAARPDAARELDTARRAPASRPITHAGERQYALQMGVFGNLTNAEDLRAKLELNGIPASIEARVHAGPFKTRQEVELARAKLKELGLDDGLLLTMKAK